jgi:hypothetical protein
MLFTKPTRYSISLTGSPLVMRCREANAYTTPLASKYPTPDKRLF